MLAGTMQMEQIGHEPVLVVRTGELWRQRGERGGWLVVAVDVAGVVCLTGPDLGRGTVYVTVETLVVDWERVG